MNNNAGNKLLTGIVYDSNHSQGKDYCRAERLDYRDDHPSAVVTPRVPWNLFKSIRAVRVRQNLIYDGHWKRYLIWVDIFWPKVLVRPSVNTKRSLVSWFKEESFQKKKG